MKSIFKYASLLMAAVMLISCSGQSGEDDGPVISGDIKLVADKNLVQSDGVDYVTLTVTVGGEVVTDGVTFFDGNNSPMNISGFKFSTTREGEYKIWANYGTSNSETIIIRSAKLIPETPNDPNPAGTSFKARVLLTEFTTVGCTACPNMKKAVRDVMYDQETGEPTDFLDKYVMVACHSGLVNSVPDPAFIKTGYEAFRNVTGYPNIDFDMQFTSGNYLHPDFQSWFSTFYDFKKDVAAGIAVSSVFEDNVITMKVTVKPAVDGAYRVGAFLLEDGIYCVQQGTSDKSMYTHDSCVRYIDSSYRSGSGEYYYGHSLGNVAAGETADYLFVWDLDEIWAEGRKQANFMGSEWADWVEENLHIAVFTSTVGESGGQQFYYVNNVVDAAIDGMKQFDYAK